jgi:hypothetical protein
MKPRQKVPTRAGAAGCADVAGWCWCDFTSNIMLGENEAEKSGRQQQLSDRDPMA